MEKYYFKATYIGDEFPDYLDEAILVADDKSDPNAPCYKILFQDGFEADNIDDNDISSYEDLREPISNWMDYVPYFECDSCHKIGMVESDVAPVYECIDCGHWRYSSS